MAFSKIVPALALALAAAQGMAQDLPPGPMRMLVGFAPGLFSTTMVTLVFS